MNLQQRLVLLRRLGSYILANGAELEKAKEKAFYENPWFIPEFIDFQLKHIANAYLSAEQLEAWISRYNLPESNPSPKNIGIVMAGNIPLAGFHDFLCAFIAGHRQTIKPSSKDAALITHLVNTLSDWEGAADQPIAIADMLKDCDAYIAVGSNNSGRYFDYYFSKYPHIIRRNRSSAAILTGNETREELERLADDVYLYFGLGCRNITKIYVPSGYDFVPLLEAFKKYDRLAAHHKYKNNYDYQLAILIVNKMYYMTNGSILLQENSSLFSPISQLHYEFYDDIRTAEQALEGNDDVQCVTGKGQLPFGTAQLPQLNDYADKTDTLQFLLDL